MLTRVSIPPRSRARETGGMGFLAAGSLIINRLKQAVPTLKGVSELTALDLDSLDKAARATPCAFVMWDGYSPGDESGSGSAQMIGQRWLVLLVVRNAQNAGTGGGVLDEADTLIDACIAALAGWEPSPEHNPLFLTHAPRPGYRPGFGFFPLAFTTGIEVIPE